jgi:hypothetical protein
VVLRTAPAALGVPCRLGGEATCQCARLPIALSGSCSVASPAKRRLGALLSSDDFGSSVERAAHGQVLWRPHTEVRIDVVRTFRRRGASGIGCSVIWPVSSVVTGLAGSVDRSVSAESDHVRSSTSGKRPVAAWWDHVVLAVGRAGHPVDAIVLGSAGPGIAAMGRMSVGCALVSACVPGPLVALGLSHLRLPCPGWRPRGGSTRSGSGLASPTTGWHTIASLTVTPEAAIPGPSRRTWGQPSSARRRSRWLVGLCILGRPGGGRSPVSLG